MKGHEPINGGFATANTFTSRLRESPLPLYRSAALVKVLLERLRRANRALGGSALHLDNARYAGERLLGIHEAQN